jgi:hypothetical protein
LSSEWSDEGFDGRHVSFTEVFELLNFCSGVIRSCPDIEFFLLFVCLDWLLVHDALNKHFLGGTPYFLFLLSESICSKLVSTLLESLFVCIDGEELRVAHFGCGFHSSLLVVLGNQRQLDILILMEGVLAP